MAESDSEFLDRIGDTPLREIGVRDGARLFALARKGVAVPMAEDIQFARIQQLEAENAKLTQIVFTVAMIDLDAGTEHDMALLEEALGNARAALKESSDE